MLRGGTLTKHNEQVKQERMHENLIASVAIVAIVAIVWIVAFANIQAVRQASVGSAYRIVQKQKSVSVFNQSIPAPGGGYFKKQNTTQLFANENVTCTWYYDNYDPARFGFIEVTTPYTVTPLRFPDYCIGDRNMAEYWCEAGKPYVTIGVCMFGCWNGTCLTRVEKT